MAVGVSEAMAVRATSPNGFVYSSDQAARCACTHAARFRGGHQLFLTIHAVIPRQASSALLCKVGDAPQCPEIHRRKRRNRHCLLKLRAAPTHDEISCFDRTPDTILVSRLQNRRTSRSTAQRRLEALRSSVDVRLAALEAALADPSRGERSGRPDSRPLPSRHRGGSRSRIPGVRRHAASKLRCISRRLGRSLRPPSTRSMPASADVRQRTRARAHQSRRSNMKSRQLSVK